MGAKLIKHGVLSPWLVSWLSEVLNRCKVQDNGRIAFEMTTQHKSTHPWAGRSGHTTNLLFLENPGFIPDVFRIYFRKKALVRWRAAAAGVALSSTHTCIRASVCHSLVYLG